MFVKQSQAMKHLAMIAGDEIIATIASDERSQAMIRSQMIATIATIASDDMIANNRNNRSNRKQ
jgi:hypothetical protein